ncbi:MAG: short-chain dehydrogenase, partial [Limnohabitans sp.]
MQSLSAGYRALVIGASGAIGQAFMQALEADPRCARVQALSRGQPMPWDLTDEASLAQLALQVQGPVHLVVDATGALTLDGQGPEK